MFGYIDKQDGKYGIVDTRDGVVEYITLQQVAQALKQGIEIVGVTKSGNKIHFEKPSVPSFVPPANRIYTKQHPFSFVFRFDFDETFLSICNINGEGYDIHNLSDAEKFDIELNYDYLKSFENFLNPKINHTSWFYGIDIEAFKNKIKSNNHSPKYIDLVNLGYVNPDGQTYSFKQFWRAETGETIDVYDGEGNNAPLSKDGKFNFDDEDLPMYSRVVENDIVILDYRTLYNKNN